jgi:hydrogenase maturation protease
MRSNAIEVRTANQFPLHPVTLSPCHLVIAYGNPLRQDDAAGLFLARSVVAIWRAQGIAVQYVEVQQLMPELVTQIVDTAVERLFFFDAARGEPIATVQLQRVDVQASTTCFGHHLAPAMLMTYADELYGHCPPAWLVTVPGVTFEHGEGVSLPVQRLLATAPVLAQQLLDGVLSYQP